jgi:hypothetical protein
MNTMADGWLQGRGEGGGEVLDMGAVIGVNHNVSAAEADLQSNNLGKSPLFTHRYLPLDFSTIFTLKN